MYTGTAVFDLLLPGDSRSLKAKRSYVRPIVAALRRFEVAAAEVGALDLVGRAEIGVAVVAADTGQVRRMLDSCERLVRVVRRSSCSPCAGASTALVTVSDRLAG